MARTATATAIKRIITKGLTGWQAGKLLLQDFIDCYQGRPSVITESDIATIQRAPMESHDIRDYNKLASLARSFRTGLMMAELSSKDACLQLAPLERALRDADKRRTVELFESFGPHVVTRKQYDDIVAAQREKKLAFEYSLSYVIEERFYAMAPQARKEIEAAGVDIESAEDFAAAVPEKYLDISRQAADAIHRLYASGKLPVVYRDEDSKEVGPLLKKWSDDGLTAKEAMTLVDMLFISGQHLYDCEESPEWKPYVDEYQQYICGDDDERFQHAYAIMDDCPVPWRDEAGYYKRPSRPSEWVTSDTELFLGLRDCHDRRKKSIKHVGAALRVKMAEGEQNARLFLAIKAILDAAVEAVGLDVPGDEGILTRPHVMLGAHIKLFNIRLEELKEERKARRNGEYRLEKALKMLAVIDRERLQPSPDSITELKAHILDGLPADDWLQSKLRCLEYSDGYSLADLLN
jgi:hypothetical protein